MMNTKRLFIILPLLILIGTACSGARAVADLAGSAVEQVGNKPTAEPTEEIVEVDTEAEPEPTVGNGYDSFYGELDRGLDWSTGTAGFGLGDPEAPVVLHYYGDFSCPHCYNFQPDMQQAIEEYVMAGDVYVIFKPILFVNPPTSIPAATAGFCAAEQGRFWDMYDQIWDIFEWDTREAYTQEEFTDRAEVIGLDVDAFTTCFEDEETEQILFEIAAEARERGVHGTPTVFANDLLVVWQDSATRWESLQQAIEAALKGLTGDPQT